MNYDQIVQYLNNSCSPSEKEAVEQWLLKSPSNREQFERLKRIWEVSLRTPDVVSPNYELAWRKIARKTGITSVRRFPLSSARMIKVAASLLILAALSIVLGNYFFGKPVMLTETNLSIQKKTVQLQDGTLVSLNTNATISFPQKFKGKQREVSMQGEAFFKVARDVEHPFIVSANGTLIKVLGTSFNIKISGTEKIEVAVVSGKVAFQPINNPTKMVHLVKGETGIYNNLNQQLSKGLNTDENLLSWETGILTFTNQPLVEVAHTLSEYYKKSFSVDPSLRQRQITVTFNNLKLEEVLAILEITLDIRITQTPSAIQLNP